MELKPGYKQTEVGTIPENWLVTPLAGLASILHGFGFQSQYFKPFGKYRLTTPGHFHETGGFRDIGDKQKFYDGPLPDGYLLNEDDLIVAMTEQADGLLGSAAFVPVGGTYLHNQRLGKIKVLSPDVSDKFLYRVFNSKDYRAKVRETAAGTKVKHTSPSRLLEIPVALPPTKAEQEAIAEALGDADALIGSMEQLLAEKRHLKQGAMQELLTGKKRLPGFKRTEPTKTEIGEIPTDWQIVQIGQIAHVKTGPFGSSLHESDYVEDGTPIVTVEHLGERSIVHTNLPMVSQTDRKRLISYTLEKGDIVFSRVGSVDRNALVSETEQGWLFSGRLLRLRAFLDDVHPQYLSYHFHSEPFKQRVRTVAVGQTMASLNTRILRGVWVALPSIDEQLTIAAILSDMDAEIAALEAKLAKARSIKQGMMQELLTGRIRLI